MYSIRTFLLPEIIDLNRFLDELYETFRITTINTENDLYIYYDTFDWRIYAAGLLLAQNRNELQLSNLYTETLIHREAVDPKQPVSFCRDIKNDAFREQLEKILSVRALLPIVIAERSYRTFVLSGKNNASLGNILIDDSTVISNQERYHMRPSIHCDFRRETSKTITAFLQYIIRKGAYPDLLFKDILTSFLHSVNRHPEDYSSKIRVHLMPAMTSYDATLIILRELFRIMRENVAGIIADTDTEFLHDFRIAIRRTRTMLGQVKKIFPEQAVIVFQQLFSGLGTLTNTTRDLDICLLRENHYCSLIPQNLHEGLKAFFTDVKLRREKERQQLIDWLKTDLDKVVFTPWEIFLASEKKGPNAAILIIDTAKKTILARYKKIIKKRNCLDASSSDSELHQMRIECKKLRYLLEFFASLFPRKSISQLIRHLKKLQDVLGEYNDLRIQQNELTEYIRTLTPSKKEVIQTAVAVGAVVSVITQLKEETRLTIEPFLSEFFSSHTKKLFSRLFS